MSHRRERIGHDIAHRLARILAERVSDPRLAGLTIVEVRPSPDASYARVFYRTLGDREPAEQALEKAKPFIRRCLAEGLRLRQVPELDFRYDTTADQGARVDAILKEIREGAKEET
jgi:ribosome-binding factor A